MNANKLEGAIKKKTHTPILTNQKQNKKLKKGLRTFHACKLAGEQERWPMGGPSEKTDRQSRKNIQNKASQAKITKQRHTHEN